VHVDISRFFQFKSIPAELRLCSALSFSLRSRGLIYRSLDPYNIIRCLSSFLSRSTQESGFQTKKEKEEEEKRKKTKNKKQKVKDRK
jgi:hypothetical protein